MFPKVRKKEMKKITEEVYVCCTLIIIQNATQTPYKERVGTKRTAIKLGTK